MEGMTATETTSTGLMLGRPTFCTQFYCGLHDKPAEGFVVDTTSPAGARFFFVNNVPDANKRRVTSLNASNDGGLWQTRLLLWILTVVYGNTTVSVDPNDDMTVTVDPNDGGLWQTRPLLWILTVVYGKHDCYCGF